MYMKIPIKSSEFLEIKFQSSECNGGESVMSLSFQEVEKE
jgi:hypothetical protein